MTVPEPGQVTPSPLIDGRFSVEGVLGQGGSSWVFRVRDRDGQPGALKVLRRPTEAAMLRVEYWRLAQIQHPNLCRARDLGRLAQAIQIGDAQLPAGTPYLLSDLVSGQPPRDAICAAEPEQRTARLLGLAEDLGQALSCLHAQGLVHRDVKPDNVLVERGGRAVLLDLGLSGWEGGAPAVARGTLAYMAPEALGGGGDLRSDLYSLGATLFVVASGILPFAGEAAELVMAILKAPTPAPAAPWLDAEVGQLITRLLQRDPLRRPQSARSVLAEIARLRGEHDRVAELSATREALPAAFVGQEQQLGAITQLLLGAAEAPLGLVVGEPGSGKSALVAQALTRYRLLAATNRAPPVEVVDPLGPQLQADMASLDLPIDDIAVALAEQLRGRWTPGSDLVAHFADLSDPVAWRLLQALAATGPEDHRSAGPRALAECGVAQADELLRRFPGRFVRIVVQPLGAADVGDLMRSIGGQVPTAAEVATVCRLSGGLPALAVEVARRWALAPDTPLDLPETAELSLLIARTRGDTSAAAREVADALAVCGESTPVSQLASLQQWTADQTMAACAPLLACGLLMFSREGIGFASSASARAWRAAIPSATRRRLHLRAAELATTDRVGRAEHLAHAREAGDPQPLDHALLLEASQALARRYQLGRALALAELTASQAPRTEAVAHLARLHLQMGHYDRALAALGDHRSDQTDVLRAEVLQRRGDYDAALQLLSQILPALGGELRDSAAAALGRLLLRRGQPDAALAACGVEGSPHAPSDAGRLEVCALASFYRGDLEKTDRLAQRGCHTARRAGDLRVLGRFQGIRGMAAFRGGRLTAAASLYGEALAQAREAGDTNATATYLGNLGSTELELGRYDRALAHLSEAAASLRALGRTTDLALALCNLGGLMLLLGDLDRVESLWVDAEKLAGDAGGGYPLAVAQMLGADLQRRRKRPGEAQQRYRSALALLDPEEAPWEHALCTLGLADTLAELSDGAGALTLLDALVETPSADRTDHDWQDKACSSRARALVALAESGNTTAPALAEAADVALELAQVCARLEARAALADLWRAAALLAALLDIMGRAGAARAAAEALTTWETIMANTPDVYRERVEHDPDAKRLRQRWEAVLQPGEATGAEARSPGHTSTGPDSPRRLRRLLAINKRLNSELRLPQLLEMVMDAAIELTNAERGFLLLTRDPAAPASESPRPNDAQVDGDDALEVRVARNIDRRSLEGPELTVSRSIAQRAAQGGDPVVTVDAAVDERFREAVSVNSLHLRSVLAVPLKVKQHVVGTIYLDHRLRSDAFGDEDVALVQDLADQAAIAIDNARLVGENERRQTAIEQLNQRLEQQVETQALELSETREQLRSSRQALQVRYDYSNLVGRSAPMLQLFRRLDRITETHLPVVIYGESGTGKELVARAIHENGPRAGKPFVGENCAAIPDTLLESILFGAERGAFTGADRMRRGFFEIADGGSLLLDEVGEMSPAMQTKLLRVLQDGEFRRVGGEHTLKTDVRVIAASNRELQQLVQAGSFREDLFYRLNVLRIDLPPLRERREDIPLLVRHFLDKHGADDSVRLTQPALARLVDHRWPGNVRELENELMRLGAMAGPLIDVADLSPTIGLPAGAVLAATLDRGASLDVPLKERVEQLERDMIRRALEQSGGNQSQAARLLGLSRYGLIKKLKRYYPDATDLATAGRND